MSAARSLPLGIAFLVGSFLTAAAQQAPERWRTLAPGLDLGAFPISRRAELGDSRITVLRIEPALWRLEFLGTSRSGEGRGRTAKQWSDTHGLTAAINAGMFGTDYKTHIGYLRFREHVNNDNINSYQSVAAFEPRTEGLPHFRIFDLDAPDVTMAAILRDYTGVVQNLRLIKRPGQNRWSPQKRMWSEAALGEDEAGRVLFVFCRSPLAMHELNRELIGLDIGLVAAQHLEGGPEAQFYVNAGGVEVELVGSYETFFRENDRNAAAWPVPNILGIRPRTPSER